MNLRAQAANRPMGSATDGGEGDAIQSRFEHKKQIALSLRCAGSVRAGLLNTQIQGGNPLLTRPSSRAAKLISDFHPVLVILAYSLSRLGVRSAPADGAKSGDAGQYRCWP